MQSANNERLIDMEKTLRGRGDKRFNIQKALQLYERWCENHFSDNKWISFDDFMNSKQGESTVKESCVEERV